MHMKTIQIPAEQRKNDHIVSKTLYVVKRSWWHCGYNRRSVACDVHGM